MKEDSPVKTIADLKGKTVGISVIGDGTQGPFNMLLKQNGVVALVLQTLEVLNIRKSLP